MDQRTDNERRQDTAPGRLASPAIGEARKPQSWLDQMRQRRRMVLIVTALIIAAIVAGVVYWLNTSGYETTDDAFIDARTVSISSQVNAAIADVPVTDNQLVEPGTVLVRLDDRDYRAQDDQAIAQVAQAKANMANIDAQVVAQQARIDQAEKQSAQAQAALAFAQQQETRYSGLVKNGAGTVEQAQQYASGLLQAEANYAAAQANAIATQKQLPVLQAQREVAKAQWEQARAAKEQADANLSRTLITAPEAGRVARLTAAKGNYAAVGQALMMFVPREVWITANFKETQLLTVRPGDPVDIRIDTYPHRKFKGHVDSIQAGSGTAFSLLPAENATGNFVKIVQRVPVKIVFDQLPDVLLGPGMSVVPTVHTK
ncbi:MAG: HlyD family secretion protein [Xanthobacteraceae bacterium]|jgi:membrane fusion protein (multidrug efflux system)